jgi:putative ABC transport system permease protein
MNVLNKNIKRVHPLNSKHTKQLRIGWYCKVIWEGTFLMVNKLSKAIFIILVISVFIGISISNIELNRTIYCNEVHMKASEQNYRNGINKYDLDDMEEKLDKLQDEMINPQKYKSDDNDMVFKVNVPKYRMLFNFKPFDLRFETEKYSVCINDKIIENLQKKFYDIQVYIGNNKKIMFKNLGSISEKIYNITLGISKFKSNVNSNTK